jgi:hypothetical protein
MRIIEKFNELGKKWLVELGFSSKVFQLPRQHPAANRHPAILPLMPLLWV